jgi:predicted Zn-dependent protease
MQAARRKRLSRWAALSLLGLAVAALGLWFAAAWEQTTRREAYLPRLEAQSRSSPYDGPLLALLGARLAEAHEQQAAAEALRRSLAAGEQQEEVYQTLAASQAALGARGRALADLRLGQSSLPGGTRALDAALARARALGPNPDSAELAQAICPDGPGPLAAAYTQGSFLNAAVSWWGRCHPDRSGFATRQQWAREEPRNAQAQRLWGMALMTNRRLPEAGAALADAAALAPRSPAVHLAYAQALEAGGLTSKAGLEYVAALNLHPDWPPALLGLGRNSQAAGLKYARQAFSRATRFAPDSASAWIGLGRACLNDDADLSRSLSAFQTAARLAPARDDYADDYAECLRKNGRPEKAEAMLRRRLTVAPEDAVCRYRLGGVLAENRVTDARLAEAEAQTVEALRLLPRQAGVERQLGTILLAEGRTAAALRLLRRAVADDPYDVQAGHVLAQAYGRVGQAALARAMSARAARLFDLGQEANVLENQKDQRFLEPGYHQSLVSLYEQTGQRGKAAQEQALLDLLRRDPHGTARSYRDYQAALARALGGAVSN